MDELLPVSLGRAIGRRVDYALLVSLFLVLLLTLSSTAQQDSSRQAALALERQGKNSEAEAAWQAVLKSHPSNSEAYAHLGLLEARQDHFTDAVRFYRKALALNPKMPGLQLNLGLALFKGGQFRQAIQEFKPLLAGESPTAPDSQRLNILLGMSHYGLAEYSAAAPYLKIAADQDPQNLELRLALAHCYLWSRQYQSVLDIYKQILALNAESAEADMLAGEAEDEMKNYDGAIQQFRAAVAVNPKQPDVHFGLGYLLWTQRQYPEAAREFQAELANDPNHAQSLLYLGDAYIQMNQVADAAPLLQKAVKIDPSLAHAHLDLGIIATTDGRNDDALRELTLSEKLMPGDVNVHWRLGRLYRVMGKMDLARAEFNKASSLNKATDQELYKKMGGGGTKPPDTQAHPSAQ